MTAKNPGLTHGVVGWINGIALKFYGTSEVDAEKIPPFHDRVLIPSHF
jgi:hypothetical protein